jgi:hypothetical protein
VRDGQRTRGGLAAHRRDCLGRRPDPHQARGTDGAGEPFALGEKAVTGVYRLRIGGPRCRDDPFTLQVALTRGRRADQHGLVGFAHVRRARIGFAVHSDGLHAELVTGTDHPKGDLAAIRNQHLVKQGLP